MPRMWSGLQRCWCAPGANEAASLALLNAQLRTHFRITPYCAVASLTTGWVLLFSVWSRAEHSHAMIWLGYFLATHAAWILHAVTRLSTLSANTLGSRRRDLLVSSALSALVASGWCVMVYLEFNVWKVDDIGLIILLACCFPAMMTTGMLVGFCTPLIALTWFAVMTAGGCVTLATARLEYDLTTMLLLVYYASILMGTVLFTSRMFVARIAAELEAESERQVVGLLLGDFEENASDWLWECDNQGRLTRASVRLAKVLGQAPGRVEGEPLASLFLSQRLIKVPSDKDVGVDCLQQRLVGAMPFRNVVVEALVSDQKKSWRLSAKPLWAADGTKAGWRGVGSDVSDARAREAEALGRELHLHHLASHDTLTGLANRRAFFAALERAVENMKQKPGTCSAMMFIDLDNFKAINDTLGHSAGDAALKNVAARLRLSLQTGDFLARLGGDEFAILMTGLPLRDARSELATRAQRVLEQLRVPEVVHRFRVDVRGSIGITQPFDMHEDAREIMRMADIALYSAKAAGRDGFAVYEKEMGAHLEHRLTMLSDLAAALERNQFEVLYQCVVALDDMRIIGCEALLRWHHPRYGLISPAEFIPLAEESGLIVPIGQWVLQKACQDAAQWPEEQSVAVNMSALQVGSPDIVDTIVAIVRDSGLTVDRVELEITESAVARDDKVARNVMRDLRARGLRLSIDDFGTGYSSMGQLRELPFNRLKLDRSFVAGIDGGTNSASCAIIDSLLHLSRSMDLSVIAEGVETEAELRALTDMGCQYAQGYLFAKPLSQRQVLPLLKAGYLHPKPQ
ncbi:MAG: EAL domain-containing protein [Burkholderiales bacterium]|nr:MAG: EAL domain-containing protein [Burkholderiales bacterium]